VPLSALFTATAHRNMWAFAVQNDGIVGNMSGESNLVSLTGPIANTPIPPSKKLRITLLSPRGPLYRHRGGIWKKTMRYAPLTLTTLASLVPAEIPAEIRIIDEGVDEISPDRIDADLVGISAITGTAPRAYEISAWSAVSKKRTAARRPVRG